MSLFFNKEKRSLSYEDVFGSSFLKLNEDNSEVSESSYFTCISYIARSIAKLPLEILDTSNKSKIPAKDHESFEKLNLKPNRVMNSYTAIETFITLGLHDGISGLYIDRLTNELYPVQITSIFVDDIGIIDSAKRCPIIYSCKLHNEVFDALDKDVIIFRYGYSRDGLRVTPIRTLLANNIDTLKKGQGYLNQIFENGLVGKIVVQTSSTIEDKKILKQIQSKFNDLFSNNGRIFTVPAGFNVNALNLSLADAEFEAIRRLSKKELASAFNLPSTVLNDYEDVNYSTGEQLQLQIYSEALQPPIVQIQREFTYKYLSKEDRLKYVIEFDEDQLYHMDFETRVNTMVKLGNNGLTTNDIRSEFGYEVLNIEGADDILVESGKMPLTTCINYYDKSDNVKGGENNGN